MFYKEQMHEERAKGALNAVCRTQSKFYKEQTHEERAKRALNAFVGRERPNVLQRNRTAS